jgi:hypothetical protein
MAARIAINVTSHAAIAPRNSHPADGALSSPDTLWHVGVDG